MQASPFGSVVGVLVALFSGWFLTGLPEAMGIGAAMGLGAGLIEEADRQPPSLAPILLFLVYVGLLVDANGSGDALGGGS